MTTAQGAHRVGTFAAGFLGLIAVACGELRVSDGLVRYRERVERTIGLDELEGEAKEVSVVRLPSRRERRVSFSEQRFGPFEFLGILGCSLSEVVAARNGSLGRVLEPTRRLDHELRVIATAFECAMTLDAERAARLTAIVEAKRADLGSHVWNALWLDADLERFLSSAPRSLIGGRDAADAPWQLSRLTAVISSGPIEGIDVLAIEAALGELRNDPAGGSVLRELDWTRRELVRVTNSIAAVARGACSDQSKRLSRDFREGYVPLQAKLAVLDRRGRALLEALSGLYHASAQLVEPPAAMRRYGEHALDFESDAGLWRRYRKAVKGHAAIWGDLLESCGIDVAAVR